MAALCLAAAVGLVFAGQLLPERGGNRADAQTLTDGTQLSAASSRKPVSLRDRLIVGLRAISKSDLAFVDRVVLNVNTGRLPKRLVDQTFFWARDRAAQSTGSGGRQRRPIIYFRPAMTAQARQLGVLL